MKIVKQFLWILPFVFFLLGYFCISQLVATKTVATPALLGKPLDDALKLASNMNLNLRIIAEKEDEELPPNVIINQVPQAGQPIKANQLLFCVISKKPEAFIMPSFTNRSINELIHFAKERSITCKIYPIPSKYPVDTIIAHIPYAQNPITKLGIIVYVSALERKHVLVPNFTNKTVAEVKDLLVETQLSIIIHHDVPMPPSHTCHECMIFDQRPLPGSLIYTDQQLNLMLSVVCPKRYL